MPKVRYRICPAPSCKAGPCGDTWHLDEVFTKINGKLVYLWRAVDQSGEVLEVLVQSRRDKRAAKKFLRKLLKGLHSQPRAIVTDKLASYAAARRELLPSVEHRRGTVKLSNSVRAIRHLGLVFAYFSSAILLFRQQRAVCFPL